MSPSAHEAPWWRGALIYQVYLRSFADSNGDGVGDLQGFITRLDYIKSLGVDAIWITPFYPSPMQDFGYDVSDYTAIDPLFGAMADFDRMVEQAHARGLKIILDHVWSHTSAEHPWFKASADPSHPEHEKYRDWYVWSKAKNNWQSVFAGSAWEWQPKREMYYLHNFLKAQPDLNWHNPAVRNAIHAIATFWLDKGVDGFRLDVCNFFAHDPDLKDNPVRDIIGVVPSFDDQYNIHNINRVENLDYLAELSRIFARYPGTLALGEMAAVTIDTVSNYVLPGTRLDAAYSSFLIYPQYPHAEDIEKLLRDYQTQLNDKAVCWVTGTHDFTRVATRWKTADPLRQKDMIVQAMALLLSMPGIASLYQGEELGLEQAPIAFDQMRDPQGINFGAVEKSRDGCRVPLPWTADGDSLGFSTAASWLPMPDSYRAQAVAEQEKDPYSILSIARQLIAWRQTSAPWRFGSIENIQRENTLLRFDRVDNGQKMTFLFNFSTDHEQSTAAWPGKKILHSQGCSNQGDRICLAPYGFAIGE